MAVALAPAFQTAWCEGYVPMAWRGGRHVALWKGKQTPTDCSSYRGLLVADALSKAFAMSVYDDLREAVIAHAPASQYGGVADGGTDLAHHTLRSALQAARGLGV